MKSLRLTIALLLGIFLNAYAQSPAIEISLEKITGSSNDWNMSFTVDLSETVRDGFALELPGTIKTVPVSLQLNGESLWLKKSEEPPSLEFTLTWFKDDSGRVIFRFTENRLNAGDQLVINCTANIKEPPATESEVTLKRLIRRGENVLSGEETWISRTLPTIEETN
jgi:hypothetical protein